MRLFRLLCAVVCLSFCGAAFAAENHLELWSMLTQKERAVELENLAANYMKDHPGVTIKITTMPWAGALDKIIAATMAGNAPDLMTLGMGVPQTLSGMGALARMEDVIDAVGGQTAFIKNGLDLGIDENGAFYALPLYITPYVAYYRQSWIDKAGITKLPATWEEYYALCKAVTNPAENRYGFGIPLGDLHAWKTIWTFLQANNVDLVNRNASGEWFVDLDAAARARAVETYDFLYKLVKDCAPEGTVTYTQTNVREMVANGSIMSRIDTPEIYYNVRQIAPDAIGDVSYFECPPRVKTGSGMGGVALGVAAKGNVDLAKDFLKYMYSGETMAPFFVSYAHAMFPAKNDMFASAAYQNGLPPELKKMVPDLALKILSTSTGLVMANGPFPGSGEFEAQSVLGNALVRMLTSNYSAEQAVDYVVAELENMM